MTDKLTLPGSTGLHRHRALPAQQHLVATDLPIELHPGFA